jgi:hypothetical protein
MAYDRFEPERFNPLGSVVRNRSGEVRRCRGLSAGRPQPGATTRGKWLTRVAALSLLQAATANPCLAAEETAPPVPTVTVAYNSDAEETAQAVRAIESHLADLGGLTVTVEPVSAPSLAEWLRRASGTPESASSLGQIYVDAGGQGELLLFFTEPGGDLSLIRRIRPRSPAGRVALEEAGIVVRSLLEALLEGGHVGVLPSPEVPPVVTPPVVAPPAPSLPVDVPREPPVHRRRAAISVRYSGTSFASSALTSGVSFGLRAYPWAGLAPLSLGATYTVFYPATVNFPSTQIELKRHPIELGLAYESAGTLGLTAEIVAIADYVARQTITTGSTLQRTAPSGRWLFGSSARAGACLSPSNEQHWCLTGGVDLYFNSLSYVVLQPEGETRASLSRLRPRLDAGVSFDFL